MANSVRFKSLVKRLRELRRRFLPQTFSATITYSDDELDKARAFRLLTHAEIEAYLEDVVTDAVLNKLGAWKSNRSFSYTLFSMVTTSPGNMAPMGEGSTVEVDAIINHAARQFFHNKRENHGIKRDNLVKLLVPIGIALLDLDATWLINMEEFGKRRGEVSHSSITTQQPLNPESEFSDVVELVKGLKKLDCKVTSL